MQTTGLLRSEFVELRQFAARYPDLMAAANVNLRLLAVLAHPDDESLGVGATLAKYASEGVETSLVTATRGQAGRYYGHRPGVDHPGPAALGKIREQELRAAAATLGVRDVTLLDYEDQRLDAAAPREAIAQIADHVRRLRPHVVITFPPDGAYGHPDHVAVSQFTTAALVLAADRAFDGPTGLPPHVVSKLYYMVWPEEVWAVYQQAFRKLVSIVDGVERQAVPWPDWAITTVVDTREFWATGWRAVLCHDSQVSNYEGLKNLPPERQAKIWSEQAFYRALSLVNGGRVRETDLFEGVGPD
jgi:LmbE family N-acetylglucosaminyl deacetylase